MFALYCYICDYKLMTHADKVECHIKSIYALEKKIVDHWLPESP